MSEFSQSLQQLVSAATPTDDPTRAQLVDQMLSELKSSIVASASAGETSLVYPLSADQTDSPRLAILGFLANNNLTYTISDPVDGRCDLTISW